MVDKFKSMVSSPHHFSDPVRFKELVAAGLGYMLTSLHAQYRDVSYLIPFILQLGLFLTVMPFELWPDWIAAPLTFKRS